MLLSVKPIMSIIFLILFKCILTETTILLNIFNSSEFDTYFKFLNLNRPNSLEPVAVFNTLSENCQEITNNFFHNMMNVPMIIGNQGKKLKTLYLSEVNEIYIFLQNINNLQSILIEIRNYKIYNYGGKFQIIICEELETMNISDDDFELIWKESILNVAVIYFYKGFNIFGYNPYTKQIVNHTATYKTEEMFVNLLQNLHGYSLKVSICNDYPRNIYNNGTIYGSDLTLLQHMVKYMNASIKYIYHESFDGILDDMVNNKTDFSFIGYFASNNLNQIKYTYPETMDDVVILAPEMKSIPLYYNLFQVFPYTAQLFYLLLAITLYIIIRLIFKCKNITPTDFSVFFDIFAISLNNPLPNWSKKIFTIKILLMSWMLNCLILNSVFQTSLTSVYIKSLKVRNMRNLYELHESQLRIYIPEDFAKLISEDNIVRDQLITDSKENVINKLMEGTERAAFALPSSYVRTIYRFNKIPPGQAVASARNIKRSKYLMLFDRLVPGHKVYLFPLQSPYLKQVDKFIRFDREHVLLQTTISNGRTNRRRRSFDINNKYISFTLSHLQTIFYLLDIGLLLSCFIFIAEIAYFKYKRNT